MPDFNTRTITMFSGDGDLFGSVSESETPDTPKHTHTSKQKGDPRRKNKGNKWHFRAPYYSQNKNAQTVVPSAPTGLNAVGDRSSGQLECYCVRGKWKDRKSNEGAVKVPNRRVWSPAQ